MCEGLFLFSWLFMMTFYSVHNFVANPARASKRYTEIKEKMDLSMGERLWRDVQILGAILKKTKNDENAYDESHLIRKKTMRTTTLIASVATTTEEDRCQNMSAHVTSVSPLVTISIQSWGLEKKSARWDSKLLSIESVDTVASSLLSSTALPSPCWTILWPWTGRQSAIILLRQKKHKNKSQQWIKKGE